MPIVLYTGVFCLPSYKLYWDRDLRYDVIASKMSRDRFQFLLVNLHFVYNSTSKPVDDPEHDRLFKIRPMIKFILQAMRQLEPKERHSVDEQVIPFKGRSHMRQ